MQIGRDKKGQRCIQWAQAATVGGPHVKRAWIQHRTGVKGLGGDETLPKRRPLQRRREPCRQRDQLPGLRRRPFGRRDTRRVRGARERHHRLSTVTTEPRSNPRRLLLASVCPDGFLVASTTTENVLFGFGDLRQTFLTDRVKEAPRIPSKAATKKTNMGIS